MTTDEWRERFISQVKLIHPSFETRYGGDDGLAYLATETAQDVYGLIFNETNHFIISLAMEGRSNIESKTVMSF